MRAPADEASELAALDRAPSRRLLLGAFGDAGHAFPMIALGRALVARGHDVCLETWSRWREPVEAAGMEFAAAPEYPVFPTAGPVANPYEPVTRAARATAALVRDWQPDACVHDVLTLAPALAAEVEGVPVATLVPHIHPEAAAGFPPYALGARLPRTALGRAVWRRAATGMLGALELGRDQLNGVRADLGLSPLRHVHGGLSRSLTLVGTLPQLEYPREWPAWTRLVGPLLWEPPSAPAVPPPGEGPVVLVAPSTAQDRERSLLRAALQGLADLPVRVIAVGGASDLGDRTRLPANAVLVPWLSYAQTMPACDLVVTHGGHGTLARALTSGCAVVVCPAGGDMAENAARVDWAGAGLRLPRRLLSARTLRLAVRKALEDAGIRARAADIAAWSDSHDAGLTAARELEQWLATVAPVAAEGAGGEPTRR